ncbi:ALG11 [Symbiodinium sp. CCMP2456]|nr:ALG11 [Symbiodinium sp. CCMP2456]
MSCSDLDYMARHRVVYEEPFYDRHLQSRKMEKLSLTILELALHMTRHANERILMNFLEWNAEHAQQHGGDLEDRIQIIRLLLESGFLWGSSDLVCHVVPPDNGYRSMVRDAFARTVLHDLVRDAVHLSWHRIVELRQSPACGGNNMDGVVWIGAQAPDSFTLTGLFNQKTVLMLAAEDGSDHDAAVINFPELVRLYTMMGAPLTTVNEYGWNAEMLAAAKLNYEHAGCLRRTVEHQWYQECEHQFAYLSSAFLPHPWSLPAWLADIAVTASLHIHWLAWLALACMLITVVFCFMLSSCCNASGQGCFTLQTIDIFFRVLWLLILNTAVVALPPIVAIAVQQQVGLFSVPPVSKWNPLPLATKFIVRITLDDRTVQEEIKQDRKAVRKAFDAARKAMWDASRSVCSQMGCGIVTKAQVAQADRSLDALGLLHGNAELSNSKMWSLHILASACDGQVTRMKLGQDDGHRARARDPWGMREIQFRFVMSYISNGLYRAILVYTLPLWLCRGSLVDFVLNAFALVYIVELDMNLCFLESGLPASRLLLLRIMRYLAFIPNKVQVGGL